VKAALEGLPGVTSVEHEAGTDVFLVRHAGKLSDAVKTVEGHVLFRPARRWLEALGRRLKMAH
jgi:SpoU rRNA methylase family enzyme